MGEGHGGGWGRGGGLNVTPPAKRSSGRATAESAVMSTRGGQRAECSLEASLLVVVVVGGVLGGGGIGWG